MRQGDVQQPQKQTESALGSGIKFNEAPKVGFTNSKGITGINKFMDTGLMQQQVSEDAQEEEEIVVGPKFKGKIRIGYEKSEAEIQREQYLKDMMENFPNVETNAPNQSQNSNNDNSEKPRFTNSKGGN